MGYFQQREGGWPTFVEIVGRHGQPPGRGDFQLFGQEHQFLGEVLVQLAVSLDPLPLDNLHKALFQFGIHRPAADDHCARVDPDPSRGAEPDQTDIRRLGMAHQLQRLDEHNTQ